MTSPRTFRQYLADRVGRARSALAAGDTPALAAMLDDAVGRGGLEEVAALLDTGISPCLRDTLGETPLIRAACVGAVDVVRLLLARGANPHERSAQGDTARERLAGLEPPQLTPDHIAVMRLLEAAEAS